MLRRPFSSHVSVQGTHFYAVAFLPSCKKASCFAFESNSLPFPCQFWKSNYRDSDQSPMSAYTAHFLNFPGSRAFHVFSYDVLMLTLCSLLTAAKLFLYLSLSPSSSSWSSPGWLKEKKKQTQQQVDASAACIRYCGGWEGLWDIFVLLPVPWLSAT